MKFRHDDDAEREMPAYVAPKYDHVDLATCAVRVTAVQSHEDGFERMTLSQSGLPVADERIFALGLEFDDLDCAHRPVACGTSRFGYRRCEDCRCWLWAAAWVASELYALDPEDDSPHFEYTLEWADHLASQYADRLPRLRLVTA